MWIPLERPAEGMEYADKPGHKVFAFVHFMEVFENSRKLVLTSCLGGCYNKIPPQKGGMEKKKFEKVVDKEKQPC